MEVRVKPIFDFIKKILLHCDYMFGTILESMSIAVLSTEPVHSFATRNSRFAVVNMIFLVLDWSIIEIDLAEW